MRPVTHILSQYGFLASMSVCMMLSALIPLFAVMMIGVGAQASREPWRSALGFCVAGPSGWFNTKCMLLIL